MTADPVQLMKELIRNACVNDGTESSGNEERSVATLRDFFEAPGEVFEPSPGRQSLIYRIAGTDPKAPTLALVPHLDVVPADPASWSVDPFAGEEVDGVVYGRGAVDMLNVTAAMAAAAAPYIRGEDVLANDLVFAAVADEENAGGLGAKRLVDDRWDLVEAEYLLTEVAYPALPGSEGSLIPVAVGEKGGFWSRLTTIGVPGHGSSPYGSDNAIRPLVDAVTGIFETPMPVTPWPGWDAFISALDLGKETRDRLLGPDSLDDAIEEVGLDDPLLARYLHALSHLTFSPNVIRAGTKMNVIADQAEAQIDVRATPGVTRHDVDDFLRKAMGSAADRVEIEPIADHVATVSPIDPNPLWEAIADSVEADLGHRRLLPTMMSVSTDARFWRSRGTVCYGVGVFDNKLGFSEMLSLFHGHDERVGAESVRMTARLYEGVLRRFGELVSS